MSEQIAGLPPADGLHSAQGVVVLRTRAILDGFPAVVGSRLKQYVKFFGLLAIFVLILPALLIASVLSLFMACVFQVPLFKPPSLPHHWH
jgi:hypothetical protein